MTRIPRLRDRLGPVRSSSYRLASRIANVLGAGQPVELVEALAGADLLLISMPARWLPGCVDELLEAPFVWTAKTILLCDRELDSLALDKLARAGATVGSLSPVDGFDERLYVVEGDRKAVRQARWLLEQPGVKVVAIDPGQKALYSAGICFATSMALPLLTASVETLRSSGLGQNDALAVADRLFQRTLRAYVKSGRKGWDGPLPSQDLSVIRGHVQALFRISPLLASYYYENAVQVTQILRQDPSWLRSLAGEIRARAARAGG
ncbi:MAG: DUF2520 domain-containing protein [Acidobacteria bacterium]|nr:DUF2520 domain-containing protein [Acidobacteriota bacterium]